MIQTIHPSWGAPKNVRALSTLRGGGASAPPYDDARGGGGLNLGMHVGDDPLVVSANRHILRKGLPSEPVWLNQVHGVTVINADHAAGVPDADASIATRPGAVCAVMTADCLPVLLHDHAGKVVGAAHAGWRGLAGGVLQRTVEAMRNAGASDIDAWLGPAIGPKSFEVGEDVRQAFIMRNACAEKAFVSIATSSGKYLADIYRLARQALHDAGVRTVTGGDYCTVSEATRFYSYRRDGRTGRMTSLIWLTENSSQ